MPHGQDTSVVPFPTRPADDAERLVAAARVAAEKWRRRPLRGRLEVVRALRAALAADAVRIASEITRRPAAETIAAEIYPLLDACRFLERHAERLLRRRRPRRPWLAHAARRRLSIEREPFGVVLVIGPGNFGLMLAGTQALQALVAGNAVLVKPAPGTRSGLARLAALLTAAGLPDGTLTITDESPSTAAAVIGAGVDKIVFTGSNATGRDVLASASTRLVPTILELSGWDACIVLDDADLDRVVATLRFGLTFNAGQTCLAPHRILAGPRVRRELERRLRATLVSAPRFEGELDHGTADLVRDTLDRGARLLAGVVTAYGVRGPILLGRVTRDMPIFATEAFGPIAMTVETPDTDTAITLANATPYGLGASIFGDERRARDIAAKLDVGVVTINDAIASVADPALPLAARRASGFGTTRGAEGLLEMTRPKAVAAVRARRPRHLAPLPNGAAELLAAWARLVHGRGLGRRGRAALDVARAVLGARAGEDR